MSFYSVTKFSILSPLKAWATLGFIGPTRNCRMLSILPKKKNQIIVWSSLSSQKTHTWSYRSQCIHYELLFSAACGVEVSLAHISLQMVPAQTLQSSKTSITPWEPANHGTEVQVDVNWSPTSCNLIPLDYFQWGAMKEKSAMPINQRQLSIWRPTFVMLLHSKKCKKIYSIEWGTVRPAGAAVWMI